MSKKRKLRRLKSLHVSELYMMVQDGDDDALEELINMQQKGRCLRYYPNGRSGPEDFGVVPIYIDSNDGAVVFRSGRPSASVLIDKETCFTWILGIPKCISVCASELKGAYEGDIGFRHVMDTCGDPDFEFALLYDSEDDGDIEVVMLPSGAESWRLGFQDSVSLLRELCKACESKGWVYGHNASDSDLKLLSAVLRSSEHE